MQSYVNPLHIYLTIVSILILYIYNRLDDNSIDEYKTGLECCSKYSVSFHYIRPPTYNMKCFYNEIYKNIEVEII